MKQIIKKFNNLVKKTIFKVQNKTNNNFKISNFNSFLITFIALLFIYIFYLLIPILYEKTWVQNNIKNKLFNEFKINLSPFADISYRILPAPHFLIKDSKILVNDDKKPKSIAETKNIQVFLSQVNFFNKEKMNLIRVVINDANITLLRGDLKLLNETRDKNFSNKKIIINNSNIFFKNNLGEVTSIIKIDKIILFFDDEKKFNLINLSGEVFNVPFSFDLKSYNNSGKFEEINFDSKSLKLNIFNKSVTEKNNLIYGKNIISFLNSTINTKYNVKEKLIIFESHNSRINNYKINYNGELSINPFDLNLNVHLDDYKISNLFSINPILNEFINSGLLFNENISINTSITVESNSRNEFFQNAEIHFRIINGKIDLDKTRLISDDIGSLELKNSNLFFKNNKLVFNGDILIDIKNSDHLFSFLNVNKASRKDLKNISINLDYDFSNNQFKFNNIKINNNSVNDKLLTIIEGFNNNNLNNLNKSRRLINSLLKAYVG